METISKKENFFIEHQKHENIDMALDQKLRKLASVQKIDQIFSHSNANKLEIAKVLGWEIVIPTSIYKENQKIIYFEIDSKLPEASWSEFMRSENFKVKTRKIRDRISQGLILPFTILDDKNADEKYNIGDDLTKMLRITKYENDADLISEKITKKINKSKNTNIENSFIDKKQLKKEMLQKHQEELDIKRESLAFPSHLGIPKTDEPRIQSFPILLDVFKGKPYYTSLKYDGSSATFCFDINNKIKVEGKNNSTKLMNLSNGNINKIDIEKNTNNRINEEHNFEFIICSRNYKTLEFPYKKAAEIYDIESKLKKAGYHIAIQCEIYGPKVGTNSHKKTQITIAVFNVFDMKEKRFFDLDEMGKFCIEYNLPMVQILEKGDAFNYNSIEELIEKSKGNIENTDTPIEGIVFRTQKNFHILSYEEELSDKLENFSFEEKKENFEKLTRKSFKVINNEYLFNKK